MKTLLYLFISVLLISPVQETKEKHTVYKVIEHYKEYETQPFLIEVDNGNTTEYFKTDFMGRKDLIPYAVQKGTRLYKIKDGRIIFWKDLLSD